MSNKTIRNKVIVVAGFGAYLVATFAGVNFYEHYNVEFFDDSNNSIEIHQTDGIMSYSTLKLHENELNKKNIEINVDNGAFIGSKTYRDTNGDKEVDIIYLFNGMFKRGIEFQSFYREKHLKSHPDLFKEADKAFKSKYEEFRPRLEEMVKKHIKK